jgi:hypothetical protein
MIPWGLWLCRCHCQKWMSNSLQPNTLTHTHSHTLNTVTHTHTLTHTHTTHSHSHTVTHTYTHTHTHTIMAPLGQLLLFLLVSLQIAPSWRDCFCPPTLKFHVTLLFPVSVPYLPLGHFFFKCMCSISSSLTFFWSDSSTKVGTP